MAMVPTHARALTRLLDPLRESPLQLVEQAVLACQIATWVFLANTGKLPPELMPDRAAWSGDRIASVFRHLQQLDTLHGNGEAFLTQPSTLAHVRDQTFTHLIDEAERLVGGEFVGPELYAELLAGLPSNGQLGHFSLPQELIDLLIGLAGPEEGDSLYIPFDSALQLSLAAAKTGAKPYAELRVQSPLPYLANLLAGQPVTISAGDPLRQPGYTDGPRLRQFTNSVAFPPLGGRYELDLVERDLYRRFPERTSAGHVLAVRHILAQTTARAVILSANSLLFGMGAERALRVDLVERSLRAVIALPPATLFGSAIPLSILVLDQRPSAVDSDVLFVDGNDERFHKRDGKGRTTLQGWRELLKAVQTGDDPAVFRVTREEIKANDYQLMVARYARSDALDAVEAALRQGEVRALEDLVEFIRPVPVVPSGSETEASVEVLEVGAGDLIEHDYIRQPTKTVRLAALKNTLQPLDILISVKGSVGKVGLVPPNLTESWVAGQTCLVLRLAQGGQHQAQHTPRSLFLFLRSALGKACLQRIVSGAAVPLIQLRELRKLPVVLPTAEQAQEADRIFQEVVGMQREVDSLRARQESLAGECWPLPITTNQKELAQPGEFV
jgi:type I restriction enzyme M protein